MYIIEIKSEEEYDELFGPQCEWRKLPPGQFAGWLRTGRTIAIQTGTNYACLWLEDEHTDKQIVCMNEHKRRQARES